MCVRRRWVIFLYSESKQDVIAAHMMDCKMREVKREETREGVTTKGGKRSRRESSGLYCLIG